MKLKPFAFIIINTFINTFYDHLFYYQKSLPTSTSNAEFTQRLYSVHAARPKRFQGAIEDPVFRLVLSVCLCTGHFVMVPLTWLHCLTHFSLIISLIYIISKRISKFMMPDKRCKMKIGLYILNKLLGKSSITHSCKFIRSTYPTTCL